MNAPRNGLPINQSAWDTWDRIGSRSWVLFRSSCPWYHWKELVCGFMGKSFQSKLGENWGRYEKRKLELKGNSQKCEFSVAWGTNGSELNRTEWCIYTLHYIDNHQCLIRNRELKGEKNGTPIRGRNMNVKSVVFILRHRMWHRWKDHYKSFQGVFFPKWTDKNWRRYSIFFPLS